MNFRLSPEVKALLGSTQVKMFKLSKRQSNYYNSPEFYNRRPDLAPRNVYLREGRIISMDEVKKTINNFGKKSFSEKISDFVSNIINLFNRK